MCLLTFIPAGIQPDMESLANGTEFNRDGHGYAIIHDGRLIIRKDLIAERILEQFEKDREAMPDGPALFHSRMSTHGTVNTKNCHPFHVGGDQRTVIAHNGILPQVVWPSKKDKRSDTRIAAEDFIPRLGLLWTRRTRIAIEKWMGAGNKMVVLTVNRRYKQQAFILNEAAGIWDGGVWYSNDGYQGYDRFITKTGKYYGAWWEDEKKDNERWPREWTECDACAQPWAECDCYVPASVKDRPVEYRDGKGSKVIYHPATGKTEVTYSASDTDSCCDEIDAAVNELDHPTTIG